MTLPGIARLELPILQELVATGGADDVRFLYQRLVAYFPQITDADKHALTNGELRGWRRHVQRAGRVLDQKRQIERNKRGQWAITTAGRRGVTEQLPSSPLSVPADTPPS